MSGAARSELRLVADVGGTNVRFALIDTGGADPGLREPRLYRSADYPTLEAAIARYLQDIAPAERPSVAVVAVAGPVKGGAVHLTNGRWSVSEAALVAAGFEAARVINDYAAQALALPRLTPRDLGVIGPDLPTEAGSAVIVGAGTGLGVAAVIHDGSARAIAVTEGGHVAFAPADDVEIEVLRHLTGRFGRVSLERLLSGPGLANLHWALGRIAGRDAEPLEPPQIVARAGEGEPLCAEALERFCAIYGSAAGDFALAFGATGGVYLGGGIAPRILETLRNSPFRARFEAKGRFATYNGAIATQVIMHPYAALLGAGGAEIAPCTDLSVSPVPAD